MRSEFFTKVAGVTRKNEDGTSRQELIQVLDPGDVLQLERDTFNEYDENATLVLNSYGEPLGYLNTNVALEIAPLLDRNLSVEAVVSEVTGGDGKNYGLNIKIIKDTGKHAFLKESRDENKYYDLKKEYDELRGKLSPHADKWNALLEKQKKPETLRNNLNFLIILLAVGLVLMVLGVAIPKAIVLTIVGVLLIPVGILMLIRYFENRKVLNEYKKMSTFMLPAIERLDYLKKGINSLKR